ncbi:hypothetical protein NSZ01_02150 [Nocardioides szechwanensis]|nr:hypothetical protein NSZ01_02150 [Nocardioides szechwanensis]
MTIAPEAEAEPMPRPDRPTHMRRTPLLLLATLLGLAAAPFPQAPASASCAAPYLEITEPLVLERGADVVIEGRAFTEGCRDSMSCSAGFGCDDCEYDDPPPAPLEDVELRLVQGDRSWTLGITDAETAETDHQGWVTWSFDVPLAAEPGPARLVADHVQPVRIRVR